MTVHQRVSVKYMGEEAASPTNLKKCRSGKRKKKYYKPSVWCVEKWLKTHKCAAPDRPWLVL